MKVETNKERIKKAIKSLGEKKGISTAFYDVVVGFAYRFANEADFNHERENLYNMLIDKYNESDTEDFIIIAASLLAEYTFPTLKDTLGEIYEELNITNTKNGQFFTPIYVSKLMSNIALKDCDFMELENKPEYYEITDDCCGSGRMLYAAYNDLINQGVNSKDILLIGADIDLLSCCITYLQLSLMGANAIIKHQDTLKLEVYDTFYTPSFIHNKELQEKIGERSDNMNKENNFKIKIWETEFDRDNGYGSDCLDIFETKDEAIKEAKSLMETYNYACIEVLDNEEKDVYYWSDGETEEFYEKESVTEDSLDY